METVIAIGQALIGGFLALFAVLVVVAVLFGKRVEKKWDFEARFRDERGRPIGEFEIELSRVAGEGRDFTLEVELDLRHPALERGGRVEVRLADVLVMEGVVRHDGRIRLSEQDLKADIESPAAGQVCTVVCGDYELVAAPLEID